MDFTPSISGVSCNSWRAFSCTHAALKRLGAVQDRDYTLQVAPVKEMARYMVL